MASGSTQAAQADHVLLERHFSTLAQYIAAAFHVISIVQDCVFIILFIASSDHIACLLIFLLNLVTITCSAGCYNF